MSDPPYSRSRSDDGGPEGGRPERDTARTRSEGRRSVLAEAQRPSREPPVARIHLGHRLPLAWMAELWERLWPRLWLPVTVLAAFVAVALFDVLPDLSGWLHTGILAGFGMAFLASIWLAWRGFHSPTNSDAKRRLERSSGLDHRALTAIEDKLALGGGDP